MVDETIVRFRAVSRVFKVGHRRVNALTGLDLDVKCGQTTAIVGESGSGKTTLGNLILGIDRPTSGQLFLDGIELRGTRPRALRRRIQVVQQNPYSTLNPRRTVRQTLELPLAVHNLRPRRQRKSRIEELLHLVGVTPEYLDRFPDTLSGGQRQRVALARALASEPDVIVLDEPTSALDVSVQARILHLLVDLQKRFQLTYIFITHDLSVVRNIANDVAVLYRGHLVEAGSTPEVFANPKHRYTTMLLSSIPVVSAEEELLKPDWDWSRAVVALDEVAADTCSFLSRCPYAVDPCGQGVPPLLEYPLGHRHACLNPSAKIVRRGMKYQSVSMARGEDIRPVPPGPEQVN